MDEKLQPVYDALQSLAKTVENGWIDNRTLQEVWGWSFPPLSRFDLAKIPESLSISLSQGVVDTSNETLVNQLLNLPAKIDAAKAIVPNFYNGNGALAVNTYMTVLNYSRSVLEPFIGWQVVNDPKSMPAQLAKRIRNLQAEIDNFIPDKILLQTQINQIREATVASENFPYDLQALQETKKKVELISTQSSELFGQINLHTKDALIAKIGIEENKIEASNIVEQCLESYRITTSIGLAAAFDNRANRLTNSMRFWIIGLILSLVICACIGAKRYESLSQLIDTVKPSWGVIWLHILLSIVSLSPPIWFAWLSTKQIGQRFRLSEDYSFKASVAKAYEGYRREAARIDSAFEARLFSSALTRLEEAPLRLIEKDTHGSPFHEIISSDAFLKLISTIPEIVEKLSNLTKIIVKPLEVHDSKVAIELPLNNKL